MEAIIGFKHHAEKMKVINACMRVIAAVSNFDRDETRESMDLAVEAFEELERKLITNTEGE